MGFGPKAEVKREKIEGHDVTFSVDEEGTWYAMAAILDMAVVGKTLPEVRAKATARLRRATLKLEIKAHLVNVLPEDELGKSWYQRDDKARANMLRPITLTGISQRGGDVMFRFDDSGGKAKKSPHQSHADPDAVGVVVRRLNATEQKEYRRLRDAFDESRDALDKWIGEHKIENVTTFLEEQIASAVDRVEEPEPETADPRVVPDRPLRDSRFDGVKKKARRRA